jgi:NAD(P)-dependent dehydrogenase (short-subunit alcohol dehydrogenase family)
VEAEHERSICQRYSNRIRSYGLCHLRDGAAAEDLVQQVLLVVLQALRAGRVKEVDNLDTYVFGTCRNMAMDMRTEARLGSIDVLVNNAATDFLGAIEEQDERDVRAQFEVNFFGAVALLRVVLPGMRGRKRGTIVNVSSMDGIASVPVNGYYSSTKFALEGLTESLWQELEPLGLRALLVEPGSFRTGIEQRTKFSGKTIDDYSATSGAFRAMVQNVTPDMFPGDPVRAAAAIYQVVASDRPRHWVVLGSDALRRIGVKLDMQRAEIEAGKDMTLSTDYLGAGRAVL